VELTMSVMAQYQGDAGYRGADRFYRAGGGGTKDIQLSIKMGAKISPLRTQIQVKDHRLKEGVRQGSAEADFSAIKLYGFVEECS
jgi:hypothetical protein